MPVGFKFTTPFKKTTPAVQHCKYHRKRASSLLRVGPRPQVYPFEPFQFLEKPLRISFAEGIQLLREAGVDETQQGAFDDLSTVNEKILGDVVKQKFGTDFFIMDK